jgi:hypothetical protein
MAKQTFNANTFRSRTFACGTFRGTGVSVPYRTATLRGRADTTGTLKGRADTTPTVKGN